MVEFSNRTQFTVLCDLCHGSGLTANSFSGRDERCFRCIGGGVIWVRLDELTSDDLAALQHTTEVMQRERTQAPLPIGRMG